MRTAAWAAIISLTALVFWPALGAGFVGDDFMILHRLQDVDSLGDSFRFFRGEFFEYYRPLGFVSHALDWLVAGANPWQFHLTNLLLHLANTSLVFLIASAPAVSGATVSQRTASGALAALLFGLHASNHEPVIWISARFDLLATFFGLSALSVLTASVSAHPGDSNGRPAFLNARGAPPPLGHPTAHKTRGGGPGLRSLRSRAPFGLAASLTLGGLWFFLALLSKESVVALPIAAAAWMVFVGGATTADAVRRTLPWLAALGVYAILRATAGGVPATGGAARLPKLVVFGALLALVFAMGDGRWLRAREWLRPRRRLAIWSLVAAAILAALAAEWLEGPLGGLAREKLSVVGFALFYLMSPIVDPVGAPYFLDPNTRVYWLVGLAMLGLLAVLVALLWQQLLEIDAAWFAIFFLAATLIPISALTEGKRYLYLPSAAVALLAARLIVTVPIRARRLAALAVAAFVTVSAWQIARKAEDWVWAGRLTAEGAALVDGSLAPACGGRVVFLTSPVGVRGVYTHFYYETFELARGCTPEEFHVLARVLRLDTPVAARWDGPDRIVIAVPEYGGNFVLSRDLRHFDVPLRSDGKVSIRTPLGAVDGGPADGAQQVTVTLDPAYSSQPTQFFYFNGERIVRLNR